MSEWLSPQFFITDKTGVCKLAISEMLSANAQKAATRKLVESGITAHATTTLKNTVVNINKQVIYRKNNHDAHEKIMLNARLSRIYLFRTIKQHP